MIGIRVRRLRSYCSALHRSSRYRGVDASKPARPGAIASAPSAELRDAISLRRSLARYLQPRPRSAWWHRPGSNYRPGSVRNAVARRQLRRPIEFSTRRLDRHGAGSPDAGGQRDRRKRRRCGCRRRRLDRTYDSTVTDDRGRFVLYGPRWAPTC